MSQIASHNYSNSKVPKLSKQTAWSGWQRQFKTFLQTDGRHWIVDKKNEPPGAAKMVCVRKKATFVTMVSGTPLSNETTFKRPVGSSGFTTTSVGCLYPRALSCDERPFRFMRASSKRACRRIARVGMQPSTDAFVRPPPYSLTMFARPRCGRVHRWS